MCHKCQGNHYASNYQNNTNFRETYIAQNDNELTIELEFSTGTKISYRYWLHNQPYKKKTLFWTELCCFLIEPYNTEVRGISDNLYKISLNATYKEEY